MSYDKPRRPPRFPMTWDEWILALPIERFYDKAELAEWIRTHSNGSPGFTPAWKRPTRKGGQVDK